MRYRVVLPKSVQKELDRMPDDIVRRILARLTGLKSNLEFVICNQAKRGAAFTIEEIFNLTKIDHRFLVQIKEIADFEEELATAKN